MRKLIPLDQAVEILGVKKKALRQRIRDGKEVGKLSGHKGWVMLEEWLLPSYKGVPDNLDTLENEARKTEIEARQVEADIRLARAKGERDTPKVLKEREATLDKCEQKMAEITARLNELTQGVNTAYGESAEDEQKAMGNDLRNAFVALIDYIQTIKKDNGSMYEEKILTDLTGRCQPGEE